MECSPALGQNPSILQHIGDFANVFKAFIGANYLTIPFNFKQSGVALGSIGLVFIALLTDHCCQLIIKCKYAAIDKVLKLYRAELQRDEDEIDEEELRVVHKRLLNNLSYGDIGKLSFGNIGLVVVNVCLLFTQFGFCIGYFIFLGNTVQTLFPMHHVPVNNESSLVTADSFHESDAVLHSICAEELNSQYVEGQILYDAEDNIIPWDSLFTYGQNVSENMTDLYTVVSDGPPLIYLILTPLPFFMLFAIIRQVRHLGIISVLADISIFVGCVCVFAYLLTGFTLSSSYVLWNGATFMIFFGGVTGSFEGIGTIIPIESSMEGNRHNFPIFLHGAVFLLSFILAVFGILGYLRFGIGAEQMINSNIRPLSSLISRLVNSTLCFGILLTFPLQFYPVVELAEGFIFAEGRCCGPKKKKSPLLEGSDDEAEGTEVEGMIGDESQALIATVKSISMPVAVKISESVPAWKRNMLRVFLVILACGLGVVCRNFYAYFAAFIGAVGSTMLAYVLPCLFHLKLRSSRMTWPLIVKDVCIILVGICGGVMSIYTVIHDVIVALT